MAERSGDLARPDRPSYSLIVPEGRSAEALGSRGITVNRVTLPSTIVVQLIDEHTPVATEIASIGPLNFVGTEWMGDDPTPGSG